jgi:outer membrane protein
MIERGIMKKSVLCGILLMGAAAVAIVPTQVQARDLGEDWLAKERFQIRLRALGVVPDESSKVNIGGSVDVGNALIPELDLTYFITNNIALEAIAGTANHELKYGASEVGDVWILPPTVTLQYHFSPDETFSPYIGAGLNYSLFYGEDAARGFNKLDVEGGWGYALQAGADIWLNENWGLNLDIKKLFLNIDGKVNAGATPVRTDIELDPWLIGAGISYRF